MRHLFILNPCAKKVRGRADAIRAEINAFFEAYPGIAYDIFTSEWCRDTMAFIPRYINEARAQGNGIVRVHAIGGTGTLFEAVNGIVGLKDVQLAAHPYGRANSLLQYFGMDKVGLFSSMIDQVFNDTIPLDVIRCGKKYGVCYNLFGVEAHANAKGNQWIERGLPADLSYLTAAMMKIFSDKEVGQYYKLELDSERIEGYFASVIVANAPCYGDKMSPAIDAHPDDGKLEVYIFKRSKKLDLLLNISKHTRGNYRKIPELVSHYSVRKVKVSSDESMCMCIDGECFYGMSIDCEVIPNAIELVLPKGIDLAKLPLIYNRPEEGLRSDF